MFSQMSSITAAPSGEHVSGYTAHGRMKRARTDEDKAQISSRNSHWVTTWHDPRSTIQRMVQPAIQLTSKIKQAVMNLTGPEELATASTSQYVTSYVTEDVAHVLDYPNILYQMSANDSSGAAGPSGFTVTSMGNNQNIANATSGQAFIATPIVQHRLTFRNNCQHHYKLHIYEYICRKDQVTNYLPLTLWQTQLSQDNLLGTVSTQTLNIAAVGSTGYDGIDKVLNPTQDTRGQRPYGRLLHQYWKKLNYTQLDMVSGKCAEYTYSGGTHGRGINNQDIYEATVNSIIALKGVTKALIIIMEPQIVGSTSDSSLISLGDANCEWFEETNLVLHSPVVVKTKRVLAYKTADNGYWPQTATGAQASTNDLTDAAEVMTAANNY